MFVIIFEELANEIAASFIRKRGTYFCALIGTLAFQGQALPQYPLLLSA